MAIKKRSIERVKSFRGQKSGQPIESYDFDSAEQIQNFYLKEGRLIRSNGSSAYAESVLATSGPIISMHKFKNVVFLQRSQYLGCETSPGSAVFERVSSALRYIDRFFSAQWRDRLFLTNAESTKFFLNRNDDLTDYKLGEVGLYAPRVNGTSLIQTSAAGGGALPAETFYFTFTLYDQETNTESPAYGAAQSQDGLFDLSPNSSLGPIVYEQTVTANQKITLNLANLATYLSDNRDTYFSRATHFILYMGQRVGSGTTGLYDTFFRLPFANTGSPLDGDLFVDIDTFLAEAAADQTCEYANFNALTTVFLPDNNSPPPTKQAVSFSFDRAIANGDTSDTYDADKASGFRHVRFFRDQLFGIGAKGPGYTVTEMEIGGDSQKVVGLINDFNNILYGSEVYQPDYFPYLWEVGRGDGQDAIGVGVLGDQALLAFKERSTYYLAGSSPDNYVMRIMDTNAGCVHQSTIQETPFGVIVLDRSGFILFDKIGEGKKISKDIEDIVDSILFNYADTFYSAYDSENRFYYCSVVIPGSITPNITLCLDLDSMDWSTQVGGEGRARIISTSTDEEVVDLIGSNEDGTIYDFSNNQLTTFNGTAMVSVWTSGALVFGDDQHKKRMRWLYLRVRSNGNFTISVEVIPDFNENNKFVISEFNYEASQSTWFSANSSSDGTLYWDEGNWEGAGLPRKIVKIPIVCKGYSFQVRIINQDTDEARYGFELEGISAEAVMLDK